MKAKSTKLRLLLMLKALFKHTDEKHRINSVELNDYLKPYGLECTSRVLNDTMNVLRDFGVDVHCKGFWERWGVWIEDRPLSDLDLQGLVFSVATNPFLPQKQATSLLRSLTPFVTVYKEPMLRSCIVNNRCTEISEAVINAFSVTQEALGRKQRVRFTLEDVIYDKTMPNGFSKKERYALFTPKCLYRGTRSIYAVGYNHSKKRMEAIDLYTVTKATLSGNYKDPNEEAVREMIETTGSKDYIPGEQQPIYIGPAVFRCRGKYLGDLFSAFGSPDGIVERDLRKWKILRIQKAEIWPETLLWLSSIPEHAIRIVGPDSLTEAVNAYCDNIAKITCK